MEKPHENSDDFKTKIDVFISRQALKKPEKLLASTFKHLGVENSLHWTLDITLREDESQIR